MEASIVIDVLVEFARREQELTEVLAAAARHRKEARDRQELLVELADDAALAGGALDEAEAAYRRRERDLRDLEARLADRRGRQVGVADRRQHRALAEEIAQLEARIDQLENEAIAGLDEASTRRSAAEAARSDEADLAARDLAAHADLAAGVARAEAALAEIRAELERLQRMLPPDVARHVARLRGRDGHAVAWVEQGACTGCFAQLPPQDGIAADQGRRLVKCASCARYVVRKPWR
ncbi:MAG: zinc ribbon domain-containing protein [Candidatus Krumholzibacteriia bacterium]